MPHTYRFQIGALVGFGIMAIVSIPERVWGGLEPTVGISPALAANVFQSLRGFGVGWSHRRAIGPLRFRRSFNP